jgi:hypothetical protein
MSEFFDVRMVDEFRTISMCCKCETRLENGKRFEEDERELRLVREDRDVKSVQHTILFGVSFGDRRSWQARRVQGQETVDRDVNSALAHASWLVSER